MVRNWSAAWAWLSSISRVPLCQPVGRLGVHRQAKAFLELPFQLGNRQVPFLERFREPRVDHHAHPAASSLSIYRGVYSAYTNSVVLLGLLQRSRLDPAARFEIQVGVDDLGREAVGGHVDGDDAARVEDLQRGTAALDQREGHGAAVDLGPARWGSKGAPPLRRHVAPPFRLRRAAPAGRPARW